MQPKYLAMAAALLSVQTELARVADVYGKLDSQEADYRNLQQTINAALALPEDADTALPPPAVVLQAMTAEQVKGMLADLLAALPDAIDVGAVVPAIAVEIEKSDVAVLAALAETRDDILARIPSTAEEPAAAS